MKIPIRIKIYGPFSWTGFGYAGKWLMQDKDRNQNQEEIMTYGFWFLFWEISFWIGKGVE